MRDIPPIHFADAHGARIAYQDFGEGPPVVAIPPLAQNIEIAWEWEDIARMLRRFGSFCRFVHFDKRGTGASDRRSKVNDIDERVEDLRAVMDAAGIDRAHLFGSSEGGPMALLFAATYPHRVESLILFGTGPYMAPPDWGPEEVAAAKQRQEHFASVWGTPESFIVDRFAPSLAANQAYRTWHQRYERAAASQDSLRELNELLWSMDVREVLPQIDAPTLIFHRVGDQPIPIAMGRELAAGIPHAEFVELEGDDHFSYAGDQGWMDIFERWVTGTISPKPPSPAYPTSVRIETMGRFCVTVDGVEVETAAWGSRLARQLCKRLVAARGWPVTRDELFELFWPDEHDRAKLGPRLSVQLSAVRKVLRGGVAADRQSVRLDLDEVETDLENFYKAEDDGAIVAAYRGEFLPEDVYEDWTGPARDEARARFVAAARRLADAAAGRRHRDVASLARRLIAVDRYDEDAHHRLIGSLLAMGEEREASRAHDAYAAAMAELDVDVPPLSGIG